MMEPYTTSKLAMAAGISVHIVRDYVVRGLVHPVRRTPGGHGLYDHRMLARLRLVWALFEAGIDLDELAPLCQALDADGDATEILANLRLQLETRRQRLAAVDRQIATMMSAQDEEHLYG